MTPLAASAGAVKVDGPASDVVARIRAAMDTVIDPCSAASGTPMGLHEMGLIGPVRVGDDGTAHIQLRLTSPICMMVGFMTGDMRDAAKRVPGVAAVEITTDSGLDWRPADIRAAAAERRARTRADRHARADDQRRRPRSRIQSTGS